MSDIDVVANADRNFILQRFCLGSFIYHLVRGRVAFAMGTLPWRSCA